MTVTASFAAGTLSILGDAIDNPITASRDAAGNILVNGGAVAISGGPSTVANTSLIEGFGQDGNDTIALDETNGALPAASLFGGIGNDTLTGGSGADQLFGQDDDDILFGKGGADMLFGGNGNDTLTGGAGDDQVFGEAGNDLMIWNPGDGTDLFEGGADVDTAEVNGGNGSEVFTITANGTRVRFDRVSPAPFSLDIGTTENLVLHANGGDDTITAGNGLATLISLTLDGGAGNDTITGGDGDDLILGGTGNDIVTGGRGNDTALLGDDDDTFIWNPGDGSDTVEGQAGSDTLEFNGANVSEQIAISANGSRIRFTRDVGNIVMDVNGVENINFHARGGSDTITVNDLTGTDVKQVTIDLSATGNGGAGDGAADTVIVNGTGTADHITITGSGASVSVAGLQEQVSIVGSEGANDALVINGLSGDDIIDASGLPAGVIKLTIDGGDNNDVITGSAGADTIIGGNGNDTVTGGRGDDVAFLGADDDTFIWNPGDGNDTVEGQGGTDTLIFNGANIAENIDISANGSRIRFTRDVANIIMDLNGVEKIQFKALGGADHITVNDLTGTDAQQIAIDLSAAGGGGDGQADTVTVNASAGVDNISITQSGQSVLVNGLAAEVSVSGEEAIDSLQINGLNGDDVINASGLSAGLVSLVINGGDGADLIIGSAGGDTVTGGRGDDTALLGGGDDTFVWNPGDGNDIVEGQAGTDTLLFNGANVAENIDISANGSRVRFTRDVASITMDVNGVEKIAFLARGGIDHINVNDLSGTGVQQVAIDLSAAGNGGAGDGAADTVTVHGTGGADHIAITTNGSDIFIDGLPAQVAISGLEAANDKIIIDGGAGDDTFVYQPSEPAVTITGFVPGANTDDKIDLKAFAGAGIHDLNAVLALATQVGADTRIDFGGGSTLTLQGVTRTDLNADDFIFKGPVVSSVTTSGTDITAGAGDLNAGHTVTFTVTFDEIVNITGSGVPTLILNDGGIASLTGGTGTNVLTFQYTVATNENTADLAVIAADPHGAALKDPFGNDADLSGAIGSPAGILQIDTTAPHPTGVDANPATADLNAGHDVLFTVNFNEAVFVAGTDPKLQLSDGGIATFTGGSGSNALTFKYTVGANENAADLSVTAIDANGATIKDHAGNDADLSGAAINPTGILHIDTAAPLLTSIDASPASADLNAGHDVSFTVNFNEAVVVAGGIPQLHLSDGGIAKFTGGSGSNVLTFLYTVAAGENAADLAVTAADTNGATIRDIAGNDADLSGAAINPTGTLHIDTIAPHLAGITASPPSGTETAGSLIAFTLAFDEAVNVTGGGTPTLALNDGGTAVYDAAATALLGDRSKLVFDYSVSTSDLPTSPLAITGFDAHGASVTDLAGNQADLSHVASIFDGLAVNESTIPALTINGITRPELHLDAAGHIILDAAASAAASEFGTKFLYLGLPASTPFPPVPDPHSDFHLL